jgi:hypothetical protein
MSIQHPTYKMRKLLTCNKSQGIINLIIYIIIKVNNHFLIDQIYIQPLILKDPQYKSTKIHN